MFQERDLKYYTRNSNQIQRKSQKEITIVNVKESLNMNNRAQKAQKRSEIINHPGVYKNLSQKEDASQPDKTSKFHILQLYRYDNCAEDDLPR